jgi:sterol desaturase/sphingolipid hydroxylase (fatty acid hydroxylase superfamily)
LESWILSNEPAIRLGAFGAVFVIMALWEWLGERRARSQGRRGRWLANLGLSMVDSIVLRLVAPAAAVGFAVLAEKQGWGLLHSAGLSELPEALGVVVAVLILDLAIYLQHVVFHYVPVLWRLHRVHHSDQDLDFTSGVRFHPLEILLSLFFKFIVVAALGASPLAVFLFEVVLNATAMFNHGNVRLPVAIDRWLRLVMVTPDMHRVHHSMERDETDSNFGFNLPWWDRLFGTYRAQPRSGHDGMRLGVESLEKPRPRGLADLLLLPFRLSGSDSKRQPKADRG